MGRPDFSAHLGYLFTQVPLEARFGAAAAAGFEAVEHPAPFDLPATRLAEILRDNGLRMAQITSGMGGTQEKGIASLPGREAEFREAFARALDYAEEINCPFVHAMAGVNGSRSAYLGNLDVAQRLCEGRKPALLIEAISEAAVPGYHLSRIKDLLQLARSRPVKVLLDSFHARADGHDPAVVVAAAGQSLGHVHIADHPGRHEPGSGTLDFDALMAALAAQSYHGAIGFEYLPRATTHLDWLPALRAARQRHYAKDIR